MTFDVQVVHSVEEVSPEEWDRLASDQPFASHRWYRFGETVLADDVPIHLILSSGGEPVARATLWLKRQETLPISSRLARQLIALTLRRWPLLACRSPLSRTSGLVLPEHPLRDAALETIVDLARPLLETHRASFLLFDYLYRDELNWPIWTNGFVRVPELHPGTQLSISWSDFDSYLAHLSKKHRYNIRRDYRLVAEDGIQIKQYATVMDVERALALHKSVNARYRSPTDPWMRRAMENAGMVDAVWLAAEQRGRLVGCELMLGDRGSWLVLGMGLEQGIRNVYLVLGYEDIRCAIERGARYLHWGTGAYQVKHRLGFEPESNSNLAFASRWSSLQRIGHWVAVNTLQ